MSSIRWAYSGTGIRSGRGVLSWNRRMRTLTMGAGSCTTAGLDRRKEPMEVGGYATGSSSRTVGSSTVRTDGSRG